MVKCPECGEEIKESFKKCPYCGHVISKEKSKNSGIGTNKIIAIVAVVVVIAVVGVLLSGMLGGNTASHSDDKDTSASDGATEYWASINADKFHLPDCEWAKKISEDNKIIYHSREDAIADGKEPCGECNP